MLKVYLFILALFVTFCFSHNAYSLSSEGGGMSSNGGDVLHFTFREGRQYAVDLITRLTPYSFRFVDEINYPVSREVIDWTLKNKDLLLTELKNSKLDWVKGKEDTQSTCAQTQPINFAPFILSYSQCRLVASKEAAGKLLIHEAVHHFGIQNEKFADHVAMLIFDAWKNMMVMGIPLCPREDFFAKHLLGIWKEDKLVNERLGGRLFSVFEEEFKFVKDNSLLKDLRGIGSCAIMGGEIASKNERLTFVYMDYHGTKMLWFPKEEEMIAISFARAARPDQGILFIGGDHDNQPMSAFRRVCFGSKDCLPPNPEVYAAIIKAKDDIKREPEWASFNCMQCDVIDEQLEEIFKLKELIQVDLGNNSLRKIPASIGNLQKLNTLYLEDNYIHELHENIGELKNLKGLFLDENKLEDLPLSITKLRLKYFSLEKNPLIEGAMGYDFESTQSVKFISGKSHKFSIRWNGDKETGHLVIRLVN